MSTIRARALHGPVIVVGRTPSFAGQFATRRAGLPNQDLMRLMMRAAAAGLSWDATKEDVERVEARLKAEGSKPEMFVVFRLDEYAKVRNFSMGAPVPPKVATRIREAQTQYPGVEIFIHALPKEDPFVEYRNPITGESVFGDAWWRGHREVVVYPHLNMVRPR